MGTESLEKPRCGLAWVLLSSTLTFAATASALGQGAWVLSHQKISGTDGGFTGTLDDEDQFARSAAALGDLDGDNVADVAFGTWFDDDGGSNRGAVWILFLDVDGTVESRQKISSTQGGFPGTLDDGDRFGTSVAALGDLDGDSVVDVVVGAPYDDDGGDHDRGAVWVLFLDHIGTVRSYQKISATDGGFTGELTGTDYFGVSVAGLGDLDGDGVEDLAVGAHHDDDGGSNRGAVWILFLYANGKVKSQCKISATQGGFVGALSDGDRFGSSVTALGDLDGDGVTDLAVGAPYDGDGGPSHGAVWILLLNANGTVKSCQKISDSQGGFTDELYDGELFGFSLTAPGDVDGDAVVDLVVGAPGDDDGGNQRGAVWTLFLHTDGTVKSHRKISNTRGGFTGTLDDSDWFGGALAALGNLDGSGADDLAVGAYLDDDGGTNRGAAWVLFLGLTGDMNCDGEVNNFDIDPFVLALTSAGHEPPFDDYDAAFPDCDGMLADCNGDGSVNNFDIDCFVDLLT